MKEITKEIQKIEKCTVWEAVDGTTFNSREECKKYEESAQGVLRGKLKEFIVNDKYDGWDLMGGFEDHTILAIKVPTEEAKDIILQAYYLDQPWVLTADTAHKAKAILLIDQAYREQDLILFGLNCDGDLYLIDTRMNIINRLDNLDKETKE